ncbi:hypothetical protein SCYAM73S_07530 [Streptomyces cyaneofuscatus]
MRVRGGAGSSGRKSIRRAAASVRRIATHCSTRSSDVVHIPQRSKPSAWPITSAWTNALKIHGQFARSASSR